MKFSHGDKDSKYANLEKWSFLLVTLLNFCIWVLLNAFELYEYISDSYSITL